LNDGTGLGLPVVLGVVEQHGGHIEVHSELGKGTTFEVCFKEIITEEDKNQYTSVVDMTGSGRLLLVDDQALVLEASSLMLDSLGYEVTNFLDPLEALAEFRANPDVYDAVLSDNRMPKMEGKELLYEIKRVRPDITTILSSGYFDEESAQNDSSITATLSKPYNLSQLSEKLHQLLKR
jgi:CheY-like chemotaxis protein